jgi:hypothetical protein
MLKNIDPLLNADVLYALRAMGHGDALVRCELSGRLGGAPDGKASSRPTESDSRIGAR